MHFFSTFKKKQKSWHLQLNKYGNVYIFQLNDSQESVPQEAESGLMSSTPAVEDPEPVDHQEEQGAVGGVKIVLYQHPLRYNRDGAQSSGQFIDSEFNSDNESYSTPVAECHVECTSQALVEHNTDNEHTRLVDQPGLSRSESMNSVHSISDDEHSGERHSLISHLSKSRESHDCDRTAPSGSSMGSKSLRHSSDSDSIILSMKD